MEIDRPIKGQQMFDIRVECPHCWTEHGAHMHYCPLAKTTERQRMMS